MGFALCATLETRFDQQCHAVCVFQTAQWKDMALCLLDKSLSWVDLRSDISSTERSPLSPRSSRDPRSQPQACPSSHSTWHCCQGLPSRRKLFLTWYNSEIIKGGSVCKHTGHIVGQHGKSSHMVQRWPWRKQYDQPRWPSKVQSIWEVEGSWDFCLFPALKGISFLQQNLHRSRHSQLPFKSYTWTASGMDRAQTGGALSGSDSRRRDTKVPWNTKGLMLLLVTLPHIHQLQRNPSLFIPMQIEANSVSKYSLQIFSCKQLLVG